VLEQLEGFRQWKFRLPPKARGLQCLFALSAFVFLVMFGVAAGKLALGPLNQAWRVVGWIALFADVVCGCLWLTIRTPLVAFLLASSSDKLENLVGERTHDLAAARTLITCGKVALVEASACLVNAIERLERREMLFRFALFVAILTLVATVLGAMQVAFWTAFIAGSVLSSLVFAGAVWWALIRLARYKYRQKILELALDRFRQQA
jgi:hypothetical protein